MCVSDPFITDATQTIEILGQFIIIPRLFIATFPLPQSKNSTTSPQQPGPAWIGPASRSIIRRKLPQYHPISTYFYIPNLTNSLLYHASAVIGTPFPCPLLPAPLSVLSQHLHLPNRTPDSPPLAQLPTPRDSPPQGLFVQTIVPVKNSTVALLSDLTRIVYLVITNNSTQATNKTILGDPLLLSFDVTLEKVDNNADEAPTTKVVTTTILVARTYR